MNLNNIKFKISTLFILLIFLSPIFLDSSCSKNALNPNFTTKDCVECVGDYPEGNYVELTTFPIDLDLLFYEDDPVIQASKLDLIGNNSWGWLLTPWGGHFVSNHFEGASKWYFYSDRPLEIVAPIGGTVKEYRVNNGAQASVEGDDVIVDVRLVIDIGSNCAVKFEHLTILESLYNELTDRKYTFTEGEFLGYPSEWSPGFWSIDFHYWFKNEDICPYPALSTELKEKVSTLYDLQYQRAKIAGVYPQSYLCNDMEIAMVDTLWGVWEYKTGPYDSFMNQAERVFGVEGGGFTFLSRELTNPNTFHKDLVNPSKNLSSEVVGLFRDAVGTTNPGYKHLSYCMVKLLEGDNSEGILELITTDYDDWGFNTSVYTRFSLDTKGNGLEDDLLTIEYFNQLSEAQAGFTTNSIIYKRFLGYFSMSNAILILSLSIGASVVLLVTIISTIGIIRRKKKKRKD